MSDSKLRDLRRASANNPATAPTIEFPCDYPIKVVGDAGEDFTAVVCQVVTRHDANFDASTSEVEPSSNARFVSVHLTLRDRGVGQLKAICEELKASDRM